MPCTGGLSIWSKRRGHRALLSLLLILLLGACGPATRLPEPPVATRCASVVPPTPTFVPSPTPLPPPPSPLGLARLWSWQAGDILTAFWTADFDQDGRTEIAVASYDRSLYLVDAAGEERWSADTGGSVFSLEVADLDGDGRCELLAGSEDGFLRAFGPQGELLWEVALGGRVTAVRALELQGDGGPEVLAGARPGKAYALRADGTILWSREVPGAPTGFVALGGTENRAVALSTEKGAVLALDPAGIPLWQDTGHGYIRLLLPYRGGVLWGGRDGKVVALTQEGDRTLEAGVGGPVATVATVDLDGDGVQEVLAGVGGDGPGLVALGHGGASLWRLPTERGVWALAFPRGEGAEPTIAAGTDGGEIVLLDVWGRRRGQTWVPFRVHGLHAVDLDGDGEDELLARASNHLYAFAASGEGEDGERQPAVETLPVWPEGVPLRRAGEDEVVLVAVGDICPGRAVEARMLVYGAEFPFAALAPLLREADMATGNLEGVLADAGRPLRKTYTFRAQPELVAGLTFAGLDLVSLANNHALDFPDGLAEMLAVLKGAGIAAVGAGTDPYAPVFLERKGLRLAFLARNAAIGPQEGVAWAEEGELREAVASAHTQADLVIVHLHAGIEYSPYADDLQRRLARAAAEGGAALVIGHHPHAPQEVEWIGTTLVAYSLGDFVFDIDDHDIARDGVVLRVVLSREGVEGGEWIPVRIVDDVQPRPLRGADGRPVVRALPSP